MVNDKHIKIDLEFLESDSANKKTTAPIPPGNNKNPKSSKYNRKNILIIIGGVILLFLWIIFSDDSPSTSTNNAGSHTPSSTNQLSSDNDTYIIGEYRCSKYDYDKAVELVSAETEQEINATRDALEYKSREIDRLQNEIDNSYVDEYSSQYKIDQYNETVNEYNSKLTSYERDTTSFSSRVDRYNAQVETHNNYLKNNCTLNR